MIAPAQQLGFLGYLPDEDTVTSSSNPEDPNAHQDDLICYHAQSQVLTPVTTPAGYDGPGPTLVFDEASSGVSNDQTLPESNTKTHNTETPIEQTVVPKYAAGLNTDYCCSYNPAEPGSKIYSFYTAVPQKGYKTVILTLWADHYESSATIGFSVAPVSPCEVVLDEVTRIPTIKYHGWDQAQNRDKAFDAANQLFRRLHANQSLFKRLASGSAAKAIKQDTTHLMMTLNYLSHKKELDKFPIGGTQFTLQFRCGTKHPSMWAVDGYSNNNDPLVAHAHHLNLDTGQAKPLLELLSKNLTEFRPPSSCPTGVIGNVVVYNPRGPTIAGATPES